MHKTPISKKKFGKFENQAKTHSKILKTKTTQTITDTWRKAAISPIARIHINSKKNI